jgi:hypothetical protein
MVTIGNPLRNSTALVIGSLGFIGANFAIDSASTTCTGGARLTPGAHCHIGIRFAPGATGTLSATLTVTDNASNSPHLVKLHGRAM